MSIGDALPFVTLIICYLGCEAYRLKCIRDVVKMAADAQRNAPEAVESEDKKETAK